MRQESLAQHRGRGNITPLSSLHPSIRQRPDRSHLPPDQEHTHPPTEHIHRNPPTPAEEEEEEADCGEKTEKMKAWVCPAVCSGSSSSSDTENTFEKQREWRGEGLQAGAATPTNDQSQGSDGG